MGRGDVSQATDDLMTKFNSFHVFSKSLAAAINRF